MALTINSNISALSAQGSLRSNGLKSSQSMERLSTGIRINSAKDDAAGLAISARMTAKLRGISAAVRNAHDGLSILETAEGGLNSISNAIQRMRELAVQSASSTNNSSDRASLNLEAQQLSAEIDRVASSTTFNGIKLLDGSFQNKPLQIGPDSSVNDSISISIDSAKISSLGFGASTRTVTISSPAPPSPSPAPSPSQVTTTSYSSVTSGNYVGSTSLNLGDLSINGVAISAVSSPSAKDVAAAINLQTASTDVSAVARATVADSTSISTPSIPVSVTPGAVSVSVTPTTVSESGSTNLNYTFTRAGDTSSALTVNLDIGGTANNADYTTSPALASASVPVKVWTALIRNGGSDTKGYAYAMTTGLDGSIYVGGNTVRALDGQPFPVFYDAFISKYTPDGNIAWTRLLGSNSNDTAYALTTGQDGSIYLSGVTTGPLDGATKSGGDDAFITKYNPDGTKVWTRMMATAGNDSARALTTGLDGSIYVSGATNNYLGLEGQTNFGSYDGFVTKYNPDGTKAWAYQLGTSQEDRITSSTTGLDGAIYFGGYTLGSLDGQTNSHYSDAFLTKFNPDGTKVWTRIMGGSGSAGAADLATGLDGSIYLTGTTGSDAFVTKYNPDGTKVWTNLMGSSFLGDARSITTGLDGSIYIGGYIVGSVDGGTNSRAKDAFITKYNTDGTKVWTHLLGSRFDDEGFALTTGLDGSIYFSGITATQDTFEGQSISTDDNNSFLTKFSVSPQITFAAGVSSTTLTVDPTSDAIAEGSEALTISILPGSGYSVGTVSATGSIIDGNSAAVSFYSIANGDIQINGVNIGAIPTAATSSERAIQMLVAIHAQTASTGVTSSINSTTGGVTLSAADGRNIEVSTLTSANIAGSSIGIALNGTTSGNRTVTTFRSGLDLSSTSANGINIVASANGATASGLSTTAIAATVTITTVDNSPVTQPPASGSDSIAATVTSTPGNNSASSQTSTSELDLSTADSSKAAITLLDVALNKLTNTRATLGAFQNRLLAAIQNLDTTAMNLSASRSRILDTDYAVETVNLAKAQIIQQASMAMLAQANQSNQFVLALLKS